MTIIDIDCYRGDTKKWNLTVTEDDVPVDLTGATLTMSARRSLAATTYVFQRTSSPAAGITINPDQVTNKGKAVIKLASSSTSSLPSDETVLEYDVQVVTAAGDLWTVVSGKLTVSSDVTT